ncbi:hypothetical protein Mth01_13250 [Sphaerimonospora thailandensis]|uniref:Uncharacterized protein n=1 Tax=Sphaerimonospora thailandensis TaxID=795644 RepID=A0A8J3R822_9ACTN|nr:hypothetical protein Mth01_13250 [Sphaerimonospora thailandensis]
MPHHLGELTRAEPLEEQTTVVTVDGGSEDVGITDRQRFHASHSNKPHLNKPTPACRIYQAVPAQKEGPAAAPRGLDDDNR